MNNKYTDGGGNKNNYRQQSAATSKDQSSYHLSLLKKENKALSNLLAAVELNRTTAVVSEKVTTQLRSTASAKQHMHMMHIQ